MTYKEAGQVAHSLIQGYIGPDHQVMDMASFYGALVQALQSGPSARLDGSRRGGCEALGAIASAGLFDSIKQA